MTITDYLNSLAKALKVPVSELCIEQYVFGPPQKWVTIERLGQFYKDTMQGLQIRVMYRPPSKDSWLVTRFNLVPFPGCCAFMISTGVYVTSPFQRKGVNTLTNKLRQAIAKHYDYTTLICTDVITNEPERRTLAKEGWHDIYQVRNKRTGNQVAVSIKELGEDK